MQKDGKLELNVFFQHGLITSGDKTKDLSLEIFFFSHFGFEKIGHSGGSVKETKLVAQSISILSMCK